LLNFATKHVPIVLQELHGGVARGHSSSDIIVRKILDVGYWWLMMNQDVHEYMSNMSVSKNK
jgi:hypothetical protein